MIIPLTQGQFTIIDDKYAFLAIHAWHAQWHDHTKSYYAKREIRIGYKKRTCQYLGRVVLELGLGRPIQPKHKADHINRDTLDNTSQNLRETTNRANCVNSGVRRNNTSGFKGVCWDKESGKWSAYIYVDKKRINLGWYLLAPDAARVYDIAARKHWGPTATTNFIVVPESE